MAARFSSTLSRQESSRPWATPTEACRHASPLRKWLLCRLGGLHRRVGRRAPRQLHLAVGDVGVGDEDDRRSEEHTSELQSLMRISYAVFCLKKTNKKHNIIYKPKT